VNCAHSRKLLALCVGGDLPADIPDELQVHLDDCFECREFCSRLDGNRSMLRSLRQDVVTPAALAEMRRNLFQRIDGDVHLGWRVQLERLLLGEWRRPRYAVLCLLLAGIISATLFTQLRPASANRDGTMAVMTNSDTLRLSDSFREWVLLGTSTQFSHSNKTDRLQNVYLNPEAYRTYQQTGKFPEGTVLVLESPGTEGDGKNPSLVASVKNRRLPGGWGYFRFEDGREQKTPSKSMDAQALPETAGCLACHRDRGATDHVFTQFYPVLRSASGVL
jgi:hypothetical protein